MYILGLIGVPEINAWDNMFAKCYVTLISTFPYQNRIIDLSLIYVHETRSTKMKLYKYIQV